MIDKDRIKAEAEAFFEWPSKDKMYVTTVSMLIFANVIAEMAREEERNECAKVAEGGAFLHDDAPDARFGKACAKAIRMRSNAKLTGGGANE